MTRIVLAIVFACALFAAPVSAEDKDAGFRFSTDPQITAAKPKKPVRIKLTRDKDGKYSWEISGDNAEDVLKADEELRKKLGAK